MLAPAPPSAGRPAAPDAPEAPPTPALPPAPDVPPLPPPDVLDPLPVVLLVALPAAPVLEPAVEEAVDDVVLDDGPEVVDAMALVEVLPVEPAFPPPTVDSPHAKSHRPVHQVERTKANLRMGASSWDLRRK